MNPSQTSVKQASLALPTGLLMSGQVLAAIIAAVLWVLGVLSGGFGGTILFQGLVEIALVMVISLGGILAIRPGVARPAVSWAVLFIAGSLVRLVVTAGLSLLLYSAAHMAPKALVVSGFMAFIASLIIEAVITARLLSRVSPESTANEG